MKLSEEGINSFGLSRAFVDHIFRVNDMVKKAQSKKAVSQIGMAGGAAAGAAAGALLGPVGAAVGAVVGGVAGSRSGLSLDGGMMKKMKSKIVSPTKRAISKNAVNHTNGKSVARKSNSRKGTLTASKPSKSKAKKTKPAKAKK